MPCGLDTQAHCVLQWQLQALQQRYVPQLDQPIQTGSHILICRLGKAVSEIATIAAHAAAGSPLCTRNCPRAMKGPGFSSNQAVPHRPWRLPGRSTPGSRGTGEPRATAKHATGCCRLPRGHTAHPMDRAGPGCAKPLALRFVPLVLLQRTRWHPMGRNRPGCAKTAALQPARPLRLVHSCVHPMSGQCGCQGGPAAATSWQPHAHWLPLQTSPAMAGPRLPL